MTQEEFKDYILEQIQVCPTNWRYGQKVFNYINKHYGVARDVQFKDGVDCFYNDDAVDDFIDKAYNRIYNKEQ